MTIAESWETWNEGCIKEVAKVYHEAYNISNITYETTPDFVVFLSDGFLISIHFRNNHNKITEECRDALLEEIEFHTTQLKELEG